MFSAEEPAEGTLNREEYDYVGIIEEFLYCYMGYQTAWYNVNITLVAYFTLVRQMPDSEKRQRLLKRWRDELWTDQGESTTARRSQSEANPWFTYLYFAARSG